MKRLDKVNSFAKDWAQISEHFRLMFDGLGELTITEDLLSFRSLPPAVATGISITRLGELVANMPLHDIESVFTTVKFSSEPTALTLEGDGMSYTYTVPPALLAQRSI